MNTADVIALLTETTAAASVAVLLVLALRRPLRRGFGAAVGYGLWALVPASIIAVLLPAAAQAPAAAPMALAWGNASVQTLVSTASRPLDYPIWLCALWLVGAGVAVLWFGSQQRAFRRGLGRLQRRGDGLQQAQTTAGLPAALGLWWPMVVVPADFDARYTVEQRALMQAHERAHIARGDLQANALVAALRCLFWFNPLLHVAARHFRHDQELACDQRVIARHPHSRRAYGEAMFNTQLAAQPLPLGCHWGYSHPLKERIAMLKQPVPSLSRWIGGAAIVIALTLAVGFTAWAAQPAGTVTSHDVPAGKLVVDAWVRIDGGAPRTSTKVLGVDEPLSFLFEERGQRWELKATVAPRSDGTFYVASTISRDGVVVGEPKMVMRDGQSSAIGIGEQQAGGAFEGIEMELTVSAGRATDAAAMPSTHEAGATGRDPTDNPPRYPVDALAQGIGGKVMLLVDVDAEGNPTAVKVESAEPAGVFDQAAIDAVMTWTFYPGMEDGKPVAGRIRVPVEFRAKGAADPVKIKNPSRTSSSTPKQA